MKSEGYLNQQDKDIKLLGNNSQNLDPYIISKYGLSNDPYDKRPYENSAKCYFCGTSFSVKSYLQNFESSVTVPKKSDKSTITQCINCNKYVNNCSVCLYPIGLMNPYI
jgi:hypothetical protein